MEYGGFHRVQEKNMREMDEDWLNDFGCLNGLRPEDLVGNDLGLTLDDLMLYRMPSKEQLAKSAAIRARWRPLLAISLNGTCRSILRSSKRGAGARRIGRNEVTYTDYEGLDCYSMQIHDYLKYCKFGYGRATDDACRDVRNGDIDRAEGARLAERYDGGYPKELVERFCAHFDLSREEFDDIAMSSPIRQFLRCETAALSVTATAAL